MVHGPPVVFEVCLSGPSNKTEEKIKFKWIVYHTTAESLGVWKWHTAIVFHFFFQYCHFMKFIILIIYRLPTLLSETKGEFKTLWKWYFSSPFTCTSGTVIVTQPDTTWFHNRGPKYRTFHVFMTFLVVLSSPSLHIDMVMYCTSYTNNCI